MLKYYCLENIFIPEILKKVSGGENIFTFLKFTIKKDGTMSITTYLFFNQLPVESQKEIKRIKSILKSNDSIEHLIYRLKNLKSPLLEKWDKIIIELKIINFNNTINDNWNIFTLTMNKKTNKVDGDLVFTKYRNFKPIFFKNELSIKEIKEEDKKTLVLSDSLKIRD